MDPRIFFEDTLQHDAELRGDALLLRPVDASIPAHCIHQLAYHRLHCIVAQHLHGAVVRLERIRRCEADLIAVWDIDRCSRREVCEVLNQVVSLECHFGAKLYSVNQPILSTATLDPGLRQALIGLFVWIAQAESRKRSRRVKAAVG